MSLSQKNMCVIFTEGETDRLFYLRLIDFYVKKYKKSKCTIIIKNLECIGNFKKKAAAYFNNEICKKHPDYNYYIFLTYDTDVFEFSAKPPINWVEIEVKLYSYNATNVYHIKAEKMIEDWFLFDIDGICINLGIKSPHKIKGNTGLEKIKFLFKQKNRIYVKGHNTNDLINSLNIEKIRNAINKQLSCLENILYPKLHKSKK